MDTSRAFDGSTPLMAACANLPTSKSCIKVLCEYKADQRVTNNDGKTALHIALLRKPGRQFNSIKIIWEFFSG